MTGINFARKKLWVFWGAIPGARYRRLKREKGAIASLGLQKILVGHAGIEPATHCLKGSYSTY